MDNMISFTSKSGFKYSIEQDALDNLELFEHIKIANDPNESSITQLDAAIKAFVCVIGPEQNEKLRAYLKEKDGKIRTSIYRREIGEVLNSLGEAKKK